MRICSCIVNYIGGRLESHCRVTAAPMDVIQLLDDDGEKIPKNTRGRGKISTSSRNLTKRVPSSRTSHPLTQPVVQDLGGLSRTVVTFVVPLSTTQPSASTVPTSNPTGASQTPTPTQFTLHHVPEDQTGASKEAMIQDGLMMERLKVVYESSKSTYDANSALQANVRVTMILS